MPEAIRAGQPVHWRVFGEGPERALWLHCALAHSGLWKGVAGALSATVAAVAPDMPSHGRSGPWDGVTDAHDLVTAIAETFFEGDMHLVGHSFGGTVALRLAEAAPDRVRSLTLIEPVLFAAARVVAPARFAESRAAYAPIDAAVADGDWDKAARLFTGRWGAGADWESLPEAARAALRAQMPMVLSVGDVLNADSKGLLAPGAPERIAAPVHLVRGEASDPIMADVHAGLMTRLPTARETVVAGAEHMVPATHPDAVAACLSAAMSGRASPVP